MPKSENEFVAWLRQRYGRPADLARGGVVLGIGDDMAVVRPAGAYQGRPDGLADVLVTNDMLMDGVDFDTRVHTPVEIGRKALAVGLSDCAAMAVLPRWVVVGLALPDIWSMDQAQQLYLGMEPLAARYGCRIVGGDTNSWKQGLVIDVTVLAQPWPGVRPLRRDGMRPGDRVFVSGPLGGSIEGKHLSFELVVEFARDLAHALQGDLHAMMDLSDGLSIDAARMAEASGGGIEIDADELGAAISDAAMRESRRDHRSPMEHALHDGEDFELLFAVSADSGKLKFGGAKSSELSASERTASTGQQGSQSGGTSQNVGSPSAGTHRTLYPVGRAIAEPGLWLVRRDGTGQILREPIEPRGWQHFVE